MAKSNFLAGKAVISSAKMIGNQLKKRGNQKKELSQLFGGKLGFGNFAQNLSTNPGMKADFLFHAILGRAFFTTFFWEDFSTSNIDIQVLMIEWFLVSIGPPF